MLVYLLVHFYFKNQINFLFKHNLYIYIMEQIFASSVITKDLVGKQQNMAIQFIKNKREYRRQKLRASKIRTGHIILPKE